MHVYFEKEYRFVPTCRVFANNYFRSLLHSSYQHKLFENHLLWRLEFASVDSYSGLAWKYFKFHICRKKMS
jgi:hypothetical protein